MSESRKLIQDTVVEPGAAQLVKKAHKGFVKGISGNPKGKPLGTKHKRTEIIKIFITDVVYSSMPRYKKELNKLSGKNYIDAVNTLVDYVVPRLARSENLNVNVEAKEKQVIKIGETEFTIN